MGVAEIGKSFVTDDLDLLQEKDELKNLKDFLEKMNIIIDYKKYKEYFDYIVSNNSLEDLSGNEINKSTSTVNVKDGNNFVDKKSITKKIKISENKEINVYFVSDPNRSYSGYAFEGKIVMNIEQCKEKYNLLQKQKSIKNIYSYESFFVGILVQEIFHEETNYNKELEPESEIISISALGPSYIYTRLPGIFDKMIRGLRGRQRKKGNSYDVVWSNYMIAIENVCISNNLSKEYNDIKNNINLIAEDLNSKLNGITDKVEYEKNLSDFSYEKLSFLNEDILKKVGDKYIEITKKKRNK